MGYSTKFYGELKFSTPLNDAEYSELNQFLHRRHCVPGNHNEEEYYAPSLHCDFVASRTALKWNGAEKSYCMDEWAQAIIDMVLEPMGVELWGEMCAMGAREGDVWKLIATGYKVRKVPCRLVWEAIE